MYCSILLNFNFTQPLHCDPLSSTTGFSFTNISTGGTHSLKFYHFKLPNFHSAAIRERHQHSDQI